MSDTFIIRGKADVKALEKQDVRPTIIIGIGGSGGDILLRIRKRFFEKYGPLENIPIVSYLWLDTDTTEKEVGAGKFAEQISFKPSEKLMTIIEDTTRITNDLNQHPHIKKWFYPGLTKLKTMTEGAGQIRAYSRLGFFQHYETIKSALVQAKNKVLNVENERIVRERLHLKMDPERRLQVFIVFSLAGGTGSGMFLDVAFLAKTAFPGTTPTTIGYVLMPGLFNQNEDRVFANGYAALKELEHYSYENDFQVEWGNGEPARPLPGPPFTYTYLIDRMNQANTTVDFSTREIIFNMIAENIFKDFTQGDFSAYKRGVRVNLDQYLIDKFAFRHLNERQESIIEQKFITRFSSFGMASITVPADRIEQTCAYKLAAEIVDQWGSLSNSGFNASGLTKEVTDKLLPAIHMKEGSVSVQGAMEQRHDILNALSDDGQGQGQKIQNQVRLRISQTCREVNENVHAQKGQSLAQYLRAAVEKEQAKLRFDQQTDPQQWGDYSRTLYFNKKERYIPAIKKALYAEVSHIINEQHQSVGYAVALLRQMVVVLRDDLHEYVPSFEKQIDLSVKRVEENRRRYEHLLAIITRHEARSNWDGRKGTILRYDIQQFEQIATTFLNAIVTQQVFLAARDVCEEIIGYIGVEHRREDGSLHADEGLIGQLYNLGNELKGLKEDLESSSEHFRARPTSELSLMLYDPEDIENIYLPKYLGAGERKAQIIRSIGDQILLKLKTSVINLPELIREQGKEKVKHQIRDMAREPFENIKEEFDVLETLWKKYPDTDVREMEVRAVFNRARFWLNGGGAQRSYKLTPERQKILIGLPPSADERKLEEFRRMIRDKIQGSGGVEPSIQQVPDRSEIIFYSEVGGIPINWSNQVAELRMKYLRKQGDGEELHTDVQEVKFNDLVILNDQERAQLEEAHKCFLLGVIFGEIKPEKDTTGRVRYSWSERIGLADQFRSIQLGIEMRAIAELISKEPTRSKLLARAAQHLNRVYRDRDLLARFNALLAWYFQEIYPEGKIPGNDGVEYAEQSNMCRAVAKQLEAVENLVSSRESTEPGAVDEFIKQTGKYYAALDTISNKLVDNKRSLKMEVADTVVSSG